VRPLDHRFSCSVSSAWGSTALLAIGLIGQ
jgi:hypothetical protein